MNVITIQSEAFAKIMSEIATIKEVLQKKMNEYPLEEKWLDIQEACLLLKISKRTLQSYRDNHILPYSQIAGKIYFKASDIEQHLEKHYIEHSSKRF